jgi:anti-sigma-K factor RskA
VTDDELREQLALHAVGALSDEERTELDDVLRTRPDLRAELDELEAATTILADATAQAPPSSLRASVLDRIATTPQLPADRQRLAPVVPIHRRRNRFIALGAAAAAIVALVVGLVIVSPWSSGTDETTAVLEADDAQTVQMPGTGAPGSLPGVTITHSESENASVLMADKVPVPAGDRVYELWAITDNVPTRYTTFRPNADGTLSIYAPGLDPASADVWAITEEVAGGTEAPTPPILNATAA